MESQKTIGEIRTLTEALFKKMFSDPSSDVRLVKVTVEPGEDWEGNKILDVIFVFDGAEKLDVGKTLELGRLAQTKIMGMVDDEGRYPMIGFLNKKDAKVMKIGVAA